MIFINFFILFFLLRGLLQGQLKAYVNALHTHIEGLEKQMREQVTT
jgi:hypothetical protein